MGAETHIPNIVKNPDAKLLWCCDINDKILENVKEKFSPKNVTRQFTDIVKDREVDAVLIATTHKDRLNLIREFANAGKHIYVEKPFAGSFEEMFKILDIVKKTKICFCVGHNRRVSPAIQEALRIYRKHRDNPVSSKWRWDRVGKNRPKFKEEEQTVMLLRVNDDYYSWKAWAFGEGILISEMTHFVDLACYFMEKEPKYVFASGSTLANNMINIEYEDGSFATIFAASVGSFGYPKELIEVYHKGAAIIIDNLLEIRVAGVADEQFLRVFPVIKDKDPEIFAVSGGIRDYYRKILAAQKKAIEIKDNSYLPGGPDKGHYELLNKFINAIQTEGKSPSPAEDAAKATAIIFKAIESVKKGEKLKISSNDYTI